MRAHLPVRQLNLPDFQLGLKVDRIARLSQGIDEKGHSTTFSLCAADRLSWHFILSSGVFRMSAHSIKSWFPL
jgi:hypothetical protein